MESQVTNDIVKKIIREHEILKPIYYESLDIYTNSNVEIADLSKKFDSLSDSLINLISDDKLPVDTLVSVLEMIEEYALFLNDQDSRGQLAIMFFEGVFSAVENARRDNHKFKYLRILNTYLGLVSKEICAEFNINLIDAETL